MYWKTSYNSNVYLFFFIWLLVKWNNPSSVNPNDRVVYLYVLSIFYNSTVFFSHMLCTFLDSCGPYEILHISQAHRIRN